MKIPVPIAHGILRITTGFMFWQHGAQKLFGWFSERDPVGNWFSWPVGVAGMLEFFGGLLILVGFKTRPVAFLLCGQAAVIYWWRHYFAQGGGLPIENGGERAFLFCFIFLFLWAAGPGALSLDEKLASGGATAGDAGAESD